MLDRREFVVEDGVGRPPAVVAAALASGFAVVSEPPHAVRRTWLDTFDWRLFRAGLTLEQRVDDGRGELVLATLDGRQLARAPAGPDLGAIGERVAPVAGGRALLVLVETSGRTAGLRLLNRDEKTVARVVVEESTVLSSATGRLAARVTVIPVRGYERQAQLACRALLGTAGILPSAWSQLDVALAAVGRRSGDYTGKIDVALPGSAPASSGMATVLLYVLDLLEANVDGVVRDLDTEFLHDLRIAVRRTRSGLALAGDALPAGLAARFAGEFKWLGALTTPVRDLDASLENLDATAVAFDPDDAAAFLPFRHFLEKRRRAAQPILVAGLRSARFAALVQDWRAALVEVSAHPVPGEHTVAELAATRIARGYRRILKPGKAITAESAAEDLHALRKRCKELRYLLEYFASLHPPAAHRAMIKELKSVQDCLGRFQDSEFQREAIDSLAAQMADDHLVEAATLRAMEHLGVNLDVQQSEARSEFDRRFARFASAKTAAVVAALTESASG